MSLDLNNVFTKSQLAWPANNRIIAGSLLFKFSKSKTGMVAKTTKFLYLEDES